MVDKMHELAFTQNILDIALEQAGNHNATKITKINLVIGEMSGIVDDCVRFYFDFISKDTIASDATLCFQKVPLKARCRHCDITFPASGFNWTCPGCQGRDIEVVAGREFYVESIEIE